MTTKDKQIKMMLETADGLLGQAIRSSGQNRLFVDKVVEAQLAIDDAIALFERSVLKPKNLNK